MTILKTISTGNGLTTAHRVVKAAISGALLQLQVHLYPSDADAEQDTNLRWQEYPDVPLAVLDIADPIGSIERALIDQADGLFAGGTYVADATADDLETVQARKWAEIKAERDRAESGGVDVPGVGRLDTDSESRLRLVGAVTAANIAIAQGLPYSISWTLADNTSATLDAQGIIGAGFAVVAHIDAVHQYSRTLYEQIQAAESAGDVAAIEWAWQAAETE